MVEKLPLSSVAHSEILFLKLSFLAFNGQLICFSPGVTRVVFLDTSSTGYGGFHKVELGRSIAQGQWSQYEATLSSTWWKLKAVSLFLTSKLAGHRVKWFIDSKSKCCPYCGSWEQEAALASYSLINF